MTQANLREQRNNLNDLLVLTSVPAQQSVNKKIPLVLIHGWGNSSNVWQPLIPLLNRERDLLLIDLPGCGKNALDENFSLDELISEIHTKLPQRCCLLGWSLGGMLATGVAAMASEKVQALVTLATNPCFVMNDQWPWAMEQTTFQKFYEGFAENPLAIYKRFMTLQSLGDTNRKNIQEQLEQFNEVPQAKQFRAWSILLDLLKDIDNREISQSLSCPGLHFYAGNDALVPVAVAEHAYRGNSQQIRILEHCAHALHLSKTQEVAAGILAFLEKRESEAEFKENKLRVAKAFSQAALNYDTTATLQRKVAESLVAMCESREAKGRHILDLGCGTGFVSELLLQKQAGISLVLADLSQNMIEQSRKKLSLLLAEKSQKIETDKLAATPNFIVADMDALPFEESSLDLVVSSMSLQWSTDADSLFAQIYRSLKPGGSLLFTTVGETTLNELASAWQQVDDYVHVNSFLTMSALQALAEKQGFHCEKKQSEFHEQYFSDVIQLMKNLKAVGAHTVNTGKNHGLTSRARLLALQAAYEPFRNAEKLLPATWEIYYFLLRK